MANDSEIIIEIEKISHNGITKEEIILNSKGLIELDVCCEYYEFMIPLPIKLGDNISKNVKIVSATTYILKGQVREAWLASDLTGQNVKIMDKKSGLVFSYEFHGTKSIASRRGNKNCRYKFL